VRSPEPEPLSPQCPSHLLDDSYLVEVEHERPLLRGVEERKNHTCEAQSLSPFPPQCPSHLTG